MEGEFAVEAADLVRLIMGFLTAQGLHESARVLRKESGVGFVNGMIRRPTVASAVRRGDWGSVLRSTFLLADDPIQKEGNGRKSRNGNSSGGSISGNIAEQIILELAEEDNNLNMAYSLLKVHRDVLDRILDIEEEDIDRNDRGRGKEKSSRRISKARSLEQKLAEIAANPAKFANNAEQRCLTLYGSRRSKQVRREDLAREVEDQKEIPLNRLPTLIQQAMKWQSHTGQLPWVKEAYDDVNAGETKKKKSSKSRKRKRYDLVMGNVAGDRSLSVGDESGAGEDEEDLADIPQDILSKVKFGKSAVCESAVFFSQGLITGSSDSLIEIWDQKCSYKDLNTVDYPYQKEHVMGHTDASVLCMSVSNDGEILVSGDSIGKVKVWKLSTGKCLRQYQAHDTSVTALALSRDASRILSGCASGICREFGIVTQTMLQVYEGHTSYIHTCKYVIDWKFADDKNPQTATSEGWVVTSSADGTVRVWKKGLMIRILQPTADHLRSSQPKGKLFSLVVDPTAILTECPAIHSVVQVPGEESRMLVVPRSSTAFLTNLEGIVLQVYNSESPEAVFLAASITASLVYLVSSTGNCLVFSLRTGKLFQSIHEFALDTTSKTNNDNRVAEISALIHHPFKSSVLAGYSNDKTQKKGVLTIWK
jgi:WD40 repeat-containing protein SMU1